MKVGLIYTGYGTRDLVPKSLVPWVNLRAQWMGQLDKRSSIRICAVSVKFAGFEGEDDGTTGLLREYQERGEIDNLISDPQNVPETTARGMALQYLIAQGVDTIWMVDSDELYTEKHIQDIVALIDYNPWCDWFRVSFKNYVFDTKTYLAEPFTPPRIFRVTPNRYPNLRPAIFTADNDIGYRDKNEPNGIIWPQTVFVSQIIPAAWAFVPHITWQSDRRSAQKVAYQLNRWGLCSFKWDNSTGLSFDEDFYRSQGRMVPKLVHEDICHPKEIEN